MNDFKNPKKRMPYPEEISDQLTIIREAEERAEAAKAKVITTLIHNNMTEFFTINWTKLRREY